jgi:hypothetical protein
LGIPFLFYPPVVQDKKYGAKPVQAMTSSPSGFGSPESYGPPHSVSVSPHSMSCAFEAFGTPKKVIALLPFRKNPYQACIPAGGNVLPKANKQDTKHNTKERIRSWTRQRTEQE